MILMYLDNPKRKKEHIIHIEVWYGFRMCGHYDAKIQETPLMVARITVRDQTGELVYARIGDFGQ